MRLFAFSTARNYTNTLYNYINTRQSLRIKGVRLVAGQALLTGVGLWPTSFQKAAKRPFVRSGSPKIGENPSPSGRPFA